jgi:hypothetical protein
MNKPLKDNPFEDTDYVVLMEDGQFDVGHSIVLNDDYNKHQLKNRIVAKGTYNIIKELFDEIALDVLNDLANEYSLNSLENQSFE